MVAARVRIRRLSVRPAPRGRPVTGQWGRSTTGGHRLARVVLSVAATLLFVAGAVPVAGQVAAQAGSWVEPVGAVVVDGYRPPAHIGAPGNRGWEYLTEPGTVVVAAGDGVVVFAGPIGGSDYVSIQHPDGQRTTYSPVMTISVAVGERVSAGEAIATTGERLHFGVRVGDQYRDPGELFGTTRPIASTTASIGDGLRLLPAAERTAVARQLSSAGIASRSGPGVAPARAPRRGVAPSPFGALRTAIAPATALGRWLASFDLPPGGGFAQGWSGAATDTLAGGPQHTAVGP